MFHSGCVQLDVLDDACREMRCGGRLSRELQRSSPCHTKVGNVTETGAKDVGHGAEVPANDAVKGVKTGTTRTGDGVKDAVTT